MSSRRRPFVRTFAILCCASFAVASSVAADDGRVLRRAPSTLSSKTKLGTALKGALSAIAGGGAWVSHHGMTGADYQAKFDEYVKQGYRLVHVDGYDVDGKSRYAAIWEKKDGPAWVARHGMTGSQYQAEFDKFTGEGYRLTHVDGHTAGGQDRYAAIWEKKGGPEWVARHGMTSALYQAEFTKYAQRGFRLTTVSGYGGSSARYAAIWEKKDGPAWLAHHGMTGADYQAKFDEYVGEKGFRLLHVDGYSIGGKPRYAAIWEKSAAGPWVARHGLSSRGYQARFVDYVLRGYRLRTVSGHAKGKGARYEGIWEVTGTPVTGEYCKDGKCFDLERFADGIENALGGSNVMKWGFEVRRGISVIQRADGLGRTAANPPEKDFTVHDRFNPASVTKAITSIATLQLLEKKKIPLDAKIHPHLPPSWSVPASIKTITFEEVLNHTSGLRNTGGGYAYDNVKTVIEDGIDPAEKVSKYANINYALLRVLVAKLDGFSSWNGDPGTGTAARFIAYLNENIFNPLGIYDVAFKATGDEYTIFYPAPPGNSTGTTYGDWTNRPGSAGGHASVHEHAIVMDALFKGWLVSADMLENIRTQGLGFGDYGTHPDGSKAYGKGGFFPGDKNGGAELSTVIVHFDSGVSAFVVINGKKSSKGAVLNAYDAAFE